MLHSTTIFCWTQLSQLKLIKKRLTKIVCLFFTTYIDFSCQEKRGGRNIVFFLFLFLFLLTIKVKGKEGQRKTKAKKIQVIDKIDKDKVTSTGTSPILFRYPFFFF